MRINYQFRDGYDKIFPLVVFEPNGALSEVPGGFSL